MTRLDKIRSRITESGYYGGSGPDAIRYLLRVAEAAQELEKAVGTMLKVSEGEVPTWARNYAFCTMQKTKATLKEILKEVE